MNVISRRNLIKTSALGGLSTLCNVPGFLHEAWSAEPAQAWNGNKLLFIFLRGGNDSLNSLIPFGDSAYNTTNRPTLYIQPPSGGVTNSGVIEVDVDPNRALDCGNGFAGLHPRLSDLAEMYNEGDLSMVHRVGYPDQSRSHFDSEIYWENGMPGNGSTNNGMFYRAITETGWHESQILPAVTMQNNLPVAFRGQIPMANINRPQRYNLLGTENGLGEKEIAAISRLYSLRHPHKKNRELVHQTGSRFVNSIEQIRAIDFDSNGLDSDDNKIAGSPFLDDDPNLRHLFPNNSQTDEGRFDSYRAFNFFDGLKNACQVLQHTDAIITGTELGGFDTHDNQGDLDDGHGRLMAYLGWGLHAVRKYLSHADVDLWSRTTVVTLSEFGRTSRENGSAGTDHAEAGAMFVASGNQALQGGIFGCDASSWISGETGAMFEKSERYLSRRYDYRSVIGDILRGHLGVEQSQLERIIPGYAVAGEHLQAGGTSIDENPIFGEPGLFS